MAARHLLGGPVVGFALCACNAITGMDGYQNVDSLGDAGDATSDADCSQSCLVDAESCGGDCRSQESTCTAQCGNPGCVNQCQSTATTCLDGCKTACTACPACSASACAGAVAGGG